jgi:hypothetical protein
VLSVGDFTEMLWCQCRDLPQQLVRQATSHLPEGDDGQRRAPLRMLLSAFSACFFFNGGSDVFEHAGEASRSSYLTYCCTMAEFLSKVYDIYNEAPPPKDNRSSSPCTRAESIANAVAADRVIARLRVVAQQNTYVLHVANSPREDCRVH